MIEVFNINSDIYYGIIDLDVFATTNNISGKREIETKGKEYLMGHLMNGAFEIVYDEKGKPFVKDCDIHISVSHSHDKLAIIINRKEPTGIDIELIRRNVINIKQKFLSEAELADANDHTEKLLVYWAAKETLYKIYGLKEVNFIGHLFIEPFDYKGEGIINGHIGLGDFKKKFALQYQVTGTYMLVYALKEII